MKKEDLREGQKVFYNGDNSQIFEVVSEIVRTDDMVICQKFNDYSVEGIVFLPLEKLETLFAVDELLD